MIKILNLGAGVQSSTVLLMSCLGQLPKIDHCVFADTGWEPRGVYLHLAWLKEFACNHGIPVHYVKFKNLREEILKAFVRGTKGDGTPRAMIPLFVSGYSKDGGKIKRQCTSNYKIDPIEQFIRHQILGLAKGQRAPKDCVVDQWFGISSDECHRMRTSPDKWRRFVYPLCGMPEDMLPHRYSRDDCKAWLREHFPEREVPRSACLGCPFHSDLEWKRLMASPEYRADIVEFDRAIRKSGGTRSDVYLHRSMKPIDEVVFSDDRQQSLFGNECLGMCGV